MDDGKMAQDVRGAAGATEVAAAAADVRADARPAGAPEAARPAADGADAARERLTSADVSVFCEGMAMMLAAGIQVDEALSLLQTAAALVLSLIFAVIFDQTAGVLALWVWEKVTAVFGGSAQTPTR